jgi:uncharacterized OsmC-like protein
MHDYEMLNGVDLKQLFGTIEAVKATPRVAEFRFEADNRWTDGGHNRTSIRQFHGVCATQPHARPFVLDNDEPAVLLGRDQSPNPVEYVLHALAGCLTTSLVYHAAARGIRVRRVESRLEGDLDLRGFLGIAEDVRNGYEGVRVTFRIDADGASEEMLEELVRMAQARSPVFDIVSHPCPGCRLGRAGHGRSERRLSVGGRGAAPPAAAAPHPGPDPAPDASRSRGRCPPGVRLTRRGCLGKTPDASDHEGAGRLRRWPTQARHAGQVTAEGSSVVDTL